MNCVYFMYCWYYYLYKKNKTFHKIRSAYLFFSDANTMVLQVDQQIIFGLHNRSIESITTWAVVRIPRELGLTCNTEITDKIVKDGGWLGLGYGVTSMVKCRRVVVILTVAITSIIVQQVKRVQSDQRCKHQWASALSPRQCTVSQVDRNNGKTAWIALRTASGPTLFPRLVGCFFGF